jgi:hypothetical protein
MVICLSPETPEDLLGASVATGGDVATSVPLLLGPVTDGVTDTPPEPELHRPVNSLVKASEELAHEQFHHDLVALFIPFTLVMVTCVPNRANDVGEPIEPSEMLQGLLVGGIVDSGDDLLQFAVEERVVLRRVEAVPGGFEEAPKPEPVPKGLHTVDMVLGGGSDEDGFVAQPRRVSSGTVSRSRTGHGGAIL